MCAHTCTRKSKKYKHHEYRTLIIKKWQWSIKNIKKYKNNEYVIS